MQTDILYKQLTTKLDELKTAIERFEKHTPPSTAYAEQLHTAINEANKLVSAYLVLKEQKDISPDLNLHLKLMHADTSTGSVTSLSHTSASSVESTQKEIKDDIKMARVEERQAVVELPKESRQDITQKEEPKSIEVKIEPVIEKKPVDIVFEKPEVKTYPKLAINLNDKFRFINELFASNANEYHIAIEQLNNVNSLDEANAYIKGLKAIYDWKDDHEMVKNMLVLIQKRFT